jgi:rare lipoprotein A (peptidoglycan hydrolase)
VRKIFYPITALTLIFTALTTAASATPAWAAEARTLHFCNASWYGKAFHDRQTASGSRFNMHELSCAHKKYPFGIWLRVTNVMNRATTLCMVNDRGPFIHGRELDLSYAAAMELGMIQAGLSKVLIEPLLLSNQADFFRYRMIRLMESLKKFSDLHHIFTPASLSAHQKK